MNQLSNLRERIPTGERLYALLAIALIIIIALGYFLFINSSLLPQLQIRREWASQLTQAERDLLEAEASQDNISDELVQKVATAQARLDAAASAFLDEAQAAEVLGSFYRYASESGVEITDVQTQPGPEEAEKSIYDARTFQLQAEGSVFRLVDFVSRIKGEAKSLVINNVNIAEGEDINSLTMDITLYTSPYASGTAGPATPSATPPATPESLTRLDEALQVAWAAEDWQQALGLISQILAIDPNYDDMEEKLYAAHVNYGYQLLDEGDNQEATRQFNLALEIKANGKEALAGLEQAAVAPPPTLTLIEQLEQRLHGAWAEADWGEVISLIEQILAIDPEYGDMTEKLYAAHVNYGYKLAAEGRREEATAEFNYALAIKPEGAEAMTGLRELADETPFPAPPPSATPQPQHVIHVVQQGDTLYSIARRYGTTVEAIKAANGLTSNTIFVGQRLIIPTGSSSTSNAQYTIHLVRAGDTLYSIAQQYGTTVQTTMAAVSIQLPPPRKL